MMLPGPRIIIIDDDLTHLRGLADGLGADGIGCLQVHFTGDPGAVRKCPDVRVIFADLHLNETGATTGHETHFATIGGLLEENIVPNGPYVIILWTKYPDQAQALKTYLEELQNVPKPFAVRPLDKQVHLDLDGKIVDRPALLAAVNEALTAQPQAAAMLNWEDRVLEAGANTLAAITDLTRQPPAGHTRDEVLARLLCKLSIEAVGDTHVETDRFKAVNTALLPILADRISTLSGREGEAAIWNAAFSMDQAEAELSLNEAASLNSFLHIATAGDIGKACDPGAVIQFTDDLGGAPFASVFGFDSVDLAKNQFGCTNYAPGDDRFRWVLIQTEAACDHAQHKPGNIPFALGLEMPAHSKKDRSLPQALWCSPVFSLNGSPRCLNGHSRFQLPLTPADIANVQSLYRIREQLLTEFVHKLHTHGMRPGIISFREQKAKDEPATAQPAAPKLTFWNQLRNWLADRIRGTQ